MSRFPDILFVTEFETHELLKRLGEKVGLKGAVSSRLSDRRGLKVGILYKENILKLTAVREFNFEKDLGYRSRPLLEVHFKYKEYRFVTFTNHWPSQHSGPEARLIISNFLQRRSRKLLKEEPGRFIVAAGDFNSLWKEEGISSLFNKLFLNIKYQGARKGSYFYKPHMSWNPFDLILLAPGLSKVRIEDFRVVAPQFATTIVEYTDKASPYYGTRLMGVPKRYKHKNKSRSLGYSDHFPVEGKLILE